MPVAHHHCYSGLSPSYSITSKLPSNYKFATPLKTNVLSFGLTSGDSRFILKDKPISSPNFHFLRGKRGRCTVIRASRSDFYSTLNLNRAATLQEIKNSYKKLARKFHPDLNKSPEAEEKFKEISAAYEVLSDDEKRSLYDRFGEEGLKGEYVGSGVGSHGVDPFEVFDAFFSESNWAFGGRSDSGGTDYHLRNQYNQDLDIRYELSLSFEESIFGGQREIEVPCFETCDNCSGTGAKSSSCIKPCTGCGGRGGVMKSQRTPFGIMSQVSTCSKCRGDGKIITDHCRNCGGQGRIRLKRSIKVVIPPGVNKGAMMHVQGEGNFDKRRGIAGDLYIVLRIDEKNEIWRDGLNLYSKISIDYTEAILGTVIKVKTVEGLRDLKVPSGIQPGDTIKLANLGVPNIKKPSVRGDHHFIVNIQIPKDISEAERMLVEKLASLKASSKNYSIHSTEINEGNLNQRKRERRQNHAPGEGSGKVASSWTSIKKFLGLNQSRSGFASLSVDASAPLQSYSSPDSSSVISIFTVFVLTCIFSVMSRTDPRAFLLQQKRSHPPCKPSKEQH